MEEIMNEITGFCEQCSSHECCPEEECVLWRIEQLIVGKKKEPEVVIEGQTTIDDYVSNS